MGTEIYTNLSVYNEIILHFYECIYLRSYNYIFIHLLSLEIAIPRDFDVLII